MHRESGDPFHLILRVSRCYKSSISQYSSHQRAFTRRSGPGMHARRCGASLGLGMTFTKPWFNLSSRPCHVILASKSRPMRRSEGACCSLLPAVLLTQETDGKMRVGRRAGECLVGPDGSAEPRAAPGRGVCVAPLGKGDLFLHERFPNLLGSPSVFVYC